MNEGLLLLRTLRFGDGEDPSLLRRAWAEARLAHMPVLVQSERCATWLLRRLREMGAEAAVDAPFTSWLVAQVRAGAARNLLVESRAMDLAQWFTQRGIPFVFLKGVARRLLAERYPALNARVTTDVDVLLPEAEAERVWKALREEGYGYATKPEQTPHGHYHLVPLVHHDGVSVELHTSTTRTVSPGVAWQRNTNSAIGVEREGLHLLLPSLTEMLWHSVTHAELDGAFAYDLRHFQDAAALLAATEPEWSVVKTRFASAEIRETDRMLGWFRAAAWLARVSPPGSLASSGRVFDLELALRWRNAVCERSYARPRFLERLIAEGTRTEAGLGLATCLPGTPLPRRLRRGLATRLARGSYVIWRWAGG